MESHPAFPPIAEVVAKYPSLAGPVFQVHCDLLLAQQWKDLEVLDLPKAKRVVLKGRRPETEAILHVVPCSLQASLSAAWLNAVFDGLDGVSEVHLGIVGDDSSTVYYKIQQGIVKPPA